MNGRLPSRTSAFTAPICIARCSTVWRSFSLPRSIVSATTSKPRSSCSQRIATDVSRPPEYARMTFRAMKRAPAACGGRWVNGSFVRESAAMAQPEREQEGGRQRQEGGNAHALAPPHSLREEVHHEPGRQLRVEVRRLLRHATAGVRDREHLRNRRGV